MSKALWYFKLFNSIKDSQEVEFAALELESLFGKIRIVRNFSDILDTTAFGQFKSIRVQDFLAHELPYGEAHGFIGEREPKRILILRLMRRLAYIREIFLVSSSRLGTDVGIEGKNCQSFQLGNRYLKRYITNQFFLEKSQYISKLSRDENEIDRNADALFSFLISKSTRIPASSSLAVGKRLEDYFAIHEEPSLHLTHYIHPYKGKFHPKLVRALLNYVISDDEALVLDNFAGSGTLLLEACWLGLNSVGTEINPLSTLTSAVKCASLALDPRILKKTIEVYLKKLEDSESAHKGFNLEGGNATIEPGIKTDSEFLVLPKEVANALDPSIIESVLRARQIIGYIASGPVADFILVALAGAISDLARRKGGGLIEVLRGRLNDLYLRVYLFDVMNRVLKIKLGRSKTYQLDCRNMKKIRTGTVDGIINSPPYSTALDYVRNDLPQLTLLRLADLPALESDMIGNPNFKVYPSSLLKEILEEKQPYSKLPEEGRGVIKELVKGERKKEAIRSYQFFVDMD
ncbi:MAG: DNA methyltransferase, partial [Nitrososphaerales archaeon]